jgi:hypothetical protein
MGTEIVNYEERLAAMAKKATQAERPTGSSIGLRAGVLSYGGNPVPGNKLDCIVVASVHANLYYDTAYDPDRIVSPRCWAYSEDGENMAPAAEVPQPMAASCLECPMNAWGSDPKGGRGKACSNRRVLAIVPAGTTAADIPTVEIATLKLPVMSVKGWSMYVNKLDALYNRPPLAMITQIGTVPDQKSQFKVVFTDLKKVGDDLLPALFGLEEQAMKVITPAYDPAAAPVEPLKNRKY